MLAISVLRKNGRRRLRRCPTGESELNIIDEQNKDLGTVYNTFLSISRQLDDSLAAIDEASSFMLQTETGTMQYTN